MKNMHKFLNIKYITLFVIIAMLTIASIIMIAGTTKANEESEPMMLSKDMLPNLLISPEDLPWDVVLFSLDMNNKPKRILGAFGYQDSVYQEEWRGRMIDNGSDKMPSPEYSIRISIAITESPEEAADLAIAHIKSAAGIIPEITGSGELDSFADRVWTSEKQPPINSKSITFVRHNAVCSFHMSCRRYGLDKNDYLELAELISRKIDAALAGKPEPVPILPLAADYELGGDVESAFKKRTLGSRLWGNESINIALRDENRIPRLIPAKQTADGDYLVTLRYLRAVLGSNTKATRKKDNDLVVYGAEINHMGKSLVFTINSSEMKAGEKTIQLNHPVEFRENEIIVPLKSVVQEGLGKNISWEKRGEVMIGKIY